VIACTSYDEYTPLLDQSDASRTARSSGGRPGADAAGRTGGGKGGATEAGAGGRGYVDSGADKEGEAEAGAGGRGYVDSADASAPDSESSRTAEASTKDQGTVGKPIDIVDGATLRPTARLSTCGFQVTSNGSHPELIVDFGCPDIMQDFQFLTPEPVTSGTHGDWEYVPTGDPHIVQLNNVQAFPTVSQQAVLEGTKALYMPEVFRDGKVSVRAWSTDNDLACVVARYQDDFDYYRFCLSYTDSGIGVWALIRITRAVVTELERGSAGDSNFHYAPGHTLGLEFIGQTIQPYINDQQVGHAVQDPEGYSFGRVGVEAIVLSDAHFDDLTIVTY
jgi:hypothetical protein